MDQRHAAFPAPFGWRLAISAPARCRARTGTVFLEPQEFVRLPLEETDQEAFRGVPWKFRDLLDGTG